jgi:beta-lactamase regulating signal transducer with metallopeptidase domain
LVTGKMLALWALPIVVVAAALVVVAAALLVSIVGALQMRQDDRLSERGFLRLMGM